MYSVMKKGKKIFLYLLCGIFAFSSGIVSCKHTSFFGGKGKKLLAIALSQVVLPPKPEDEKFHDLFSLNPGKSVKMSSYTGAVDPVGTTIVDDFDGDGILNINETTGNVWVADYPLIDTKVAPPITMKIEILEEGSEKSKTFDSEIDASDVEENIDKSSEAVHRNEVNLRTVQFQDSFNQASSYSQTKETSMNVSSMFKYLGCAGSGSYGTSSKVSTSMSNSYGETKTKWKDVPFKNNLGRHETSVKRTEAAKKSRNLRKEIRTEITKSFEVKANAGYIRAALYISNESVNMPVKLKNILCSFMLETPDGQLLPVQSFRLRDEDYSIFEVDLYGDTMFGPYVIELSNLNTNEIKEAISLGYNPRIYIVDYEMKHVEDSNYKRALSASFTGDNLKIIEENAKGRTAGIKFVGPQFREFFRVTAFDAKDASGNPIEESRTTQPEEVQSISPGVSLEKALTRISYSGMPIEFADYVLDFSGIEPEMRIKKDLGLPDNDPASYYGLASFHVRGIKSINGIATKVACKKIIKDANGNETYIMKPIKDWNDEELRNFRTWVVYDKGRYYRHSGDYLKNPLINNVVEDNYTYTDDEGMTYTVPKVQGISGCIWPGDHYDIVYLDLTEILGLIKDFGNNPIEAETILPFNTRWSMKDTGEYPFDPDIKSQYLGEALAGDIIELRFNLNSTRYLSPNFGTPQSANGADIYTNFMYDMSMGKATQRFNMMEALDFEICFNGDGKLSNWMNISPARSPYKEDYFASFDTDWQMLKYSWDYVNQEFTVQLKVPYGIDGVGDDGLVKVYLRTALNNAYRDSIWPLKYTEVKQFRGRIVSTYYDVLVNKTEITVEYGTGTINVGDSLYVTPSTSQYSVVDASYDQTLKRYTIKVNGKISDLTKQGDWIYINLASPLTEPEVKLIVDNGFFTEWNSDWTAMWNGAWAQDWKKIEDIMPLLTNNTYSDIFSPVKSLGYTPDYVVGNWLGNNSMSNPFWNNWSDGGSFDSFLDKAFNPFLYTMTNHKMISLMNKIYDIDLNDTPVSTTNANNQSRCQIALSGNIALLVWESYENGANAVIRGKKVDITTGQGIGNDFLISTSNTDNNICPQLKISGDRALVVWRYGNTNPDVRGRLVDITTGSGIGNDFLISTTTASKQDDPQVAVSGDKAFVVWRSDNDPGSGFDIHGRVVSMTTGSLIGNELLVGNHTYYDQGGAEIASSGARCLIVWHTSDIDGSTYDIRGRLFDFNENKFVNQDAGDFLISTTNTNSQVYPKLTISGDRALVVWKSNDSGVNNEKIRARLIDMTTGASIGNDDFLVSTSNTNNLLNQNISSSDGKALITWDSYDNGLNWDLRGRAFDMANNSWINSSDFLVSTTNSYDQNTSDITISGCRGLVIWQSNDNGSNYDIRARLIDMTMGQGIGSDILISKTNANNQTVPCAAILGDNIYSVWQSMDNGTDFNIKSRSMTMLSNTGHSLNYGLSNFFVSPLIERDYSVKVKIIDQME